MLNEIIFRGLVLTACFCVGWADIIPYKDDIIYPQHPAYLSVPKYAPKDAPNWSPGHGNSFIDLSRITLSLVCDKDHAATAIDQHLQNEECVKTNFEVLIFQAPEEADKPWMDYWPSRQFCCLPDMVDDGV